MLTLRRVCTAPGTLLRCVWLCVTYAPGKNNNIIMTLRDLKYTHESSTLERILHVVRCQAQ